MLNVDKRLDHALKIPYLDLIREFDTANELNFFKKFVTWIYITFKSSIKIIIPLLKSSYKKNKISDLSNHEWILINDHGGHAQLFIDGLIEKFLHKPSILFISYNKSLKVQNDTINKKIKEFDSFTIKDLIYSINYCNKHKNNFSETGFWKLPLYLKSIFNTARALEACNFYSQLKFSDTAKLIVLCDSHWHQSIATSEFKNRGLQTFTCMHGQPSKWSYWDPFMADFILTWGNSMSDTLVRNCKNIDPKRLIKIGNTKYSELKERRIKRATSFKDLNEIVFISPSFDADKSYGLRGLESEIRAFLNLNIPNFTFSIRPYPYSNEKEFIELLIKDIQPKKRIHILDDSDFSSLVKPNRIFIGSVSSAIADVIILNGLFIGLNEELSKDIVKTMITYSEEIYFSMNGLEKFIKNLEVKSNFEYYNNIMSDIQRDLASPMPKHIDIFLKKYL